MTHREPAPPLFCLATTPDGGAGECRLSAELLTGALGNADPRSVGFDFTPKPALGAPLLPLFPIAVVGRGHGVVGFQLGPSASRSEEGVTLFAALAHLLGVTLR